MKVSEIIKSLIMLQLADTLEQTPETPQVPTVVLAPSVDSASSPEPEENIPADNLGKFMPPLQQKMELLKKAAGVDNAFDQAAEEQADDSVEDIKRLAGINPIAAIMTDDDTIG